MLTFELPLFRAYLKNERDEYRHVYICSYSIKFAADQATQQCLSGESVDSIVAIGHCSVSSQAARRILRQAKR